MVIDFNRPNSPMNAPSGRNGVQGNERAGNTQQTPTGEAPKPGTVSTTSTNDTVQLSPEAQRLQQAADKLNDQPAVNHERVAELKKAIADGSYQVDSQRVAAKMLAFETQH
ncbi:flagellar biosynthesis anti-sigma factor FlgM [Pseudomonas kunmingensis]|uniref:flagellar biosynthesis anti-sigma factor FlgM n=1 Tax=Stutzerimonas kunmingensis TaxID=1211807 RepID=UPI0015E3CEC7|nr:flagellar biosynthesis anti-sigma factor FlgM [Stutzerimonas kunmingensis]MBA1239061.1 flagellar biosynthesis anti-sigma factor FlgM [Stutzerimonas kunmingensis]MDH2242663.1 flagellar biosynthesis anti-sigma factor FlgM [Pseudomonas sp. GD03909]